MYERLFDRYTTARGTQHTPRLEEYVLQSTRTGVSHFLLYYVLFTSYHQYGLLLVYGRPLDAQSP